MAMKLFSRNAHRQNKQPQLKYLFCYLNALIHGCIRKLEKNTHAANWNAVRNHTITASEACTNHLANHTDQCYAESWTFIICYYYSRTKMQLNGLHHNWMWIIAIINSVINRYCFSPYPNIRQFLFGLFRLFGRFFRLFEHRSCGVEILVVFPKLLRFRVISFLPIQLSCSLSMAQNVPNTSPTSHSFSLSLVMCLVRECFF